MESLDRKLVSRMISLVQRHSPEGINLVDISRDYYKNYGVYLNPNDFGFKTIYDLCQQICRQSHNSLVVKDRNQSLLKSDRIFFAEKTYRQWIRKERKNQNVSLLESLVSHSLPNDIVLHHKNNCLPSLQLPEKALKLDLIQVLAAKIVNVESPNEIYIHLKSNRQKYRQLRESLRYYDAYYGDPNEKYIFPYELVIKGYYCVVRNPLDWFNWHRAIIIDEDHIEDTVTVFAIDFGNTITENRSELRLIKTEFFAYPPFAIKVSLAGIAPIGEDCKWSEESISFIQKFVSTFCAEFSMACTFLCQLTNDYYEVLLGQMIDVVREGVSEKVMDYLHEKMIIRKLAIMKNPNFNVSDINVVSRIKQLPILVKPEHIDNEHSVKSNEEVHEFTLYEAMNENSLKVKSEPVEDLVEDKSKEDEKVVRNNSFWENQNSGTKEKIVPKEVVDYKSKYYVIEKKIEERKYFLEELDTKPDNEPKYFTKQVEDQFKKSLKFANKPMYFTEQVEDQYKESLKLTNKPKYFTKQVEDQFKKSLKFADKQMYFTKEIEDQFNRSLKLTNKPKYFTKEVEKELSK